MREEEMKVAIIFDNELRPETTGFYCRRALGKLCDVEHLLPAELQDVPNGIFDLFIAIDDGLDYEIPQRLRPLVAWTIDTHICLDRAITRFGSADLLFAAQKKGAQQLSQVLGREVQWLPLACDPELHHPSQSPSRSYDVGFIGNIVSDRRKRVLDIVKSEFPNSWFGQSFFEDMAEKYGEFAVAINCSVDGDLNMRVFEALACGAALVTDANDGSGLSDLFDDERHLLCYRDEESLLRQIKKLLNDQQLRLKLATEGLRHVISNHTYENRMKTMLQTWEISSQLKNRPEKSKAYFEFERQDVQSLVPSNARRILDIGCGTGRLGAALKRRQDCFVVGVEMICHAADQARQSLDSVVQSPIEDLSKDAFEPMDFDCIVLADVLEHLRDPRESLAKCSHWLKADGCLVVSVPNNRHHSVVRGLVDGNWSYEPAGLLDEDHVRCMTRRELQKLLFRSGFRMEVLETIPGDGYKDWEQSGRPGNLDFGRMQISGLSSEEAEEFFVYQYLAKASKVTRPDYGLTSIIIVTHNQLAYTDLCISSIVAKTDEPYELIFVDNASTDGTLEYLRSIAGARVISNQENRGFAPAVNQGIQIARGKQILLLNNDTIVTTGWLEGLLESLYDRTDTGLVGPVSNNVSGPQQIPVYYSELTSLDGFAWDLRLNRQLTETDRLVGFCILFRRSVIDDIGLLDERFKVGCFEDDDFCRRAITRGYKALIASHVFVHHFGSVTFKGSGTDMGAILERNRLLYEDKWSKNSNGLPEGRSNPINSSYEGGYLIRPESPVRSSYGFERISGGELLLKRKNVLLSLCMIVRDNEDTIEACLDSIYPWVDEIVIVDTGSKDKTPEICRKFGARMFEFPWCDDFSAARNESLKPARGKWIFWMDSDDTISPEQGRQLRQLAYGVHSPDCFGYVMQVHCPSDDDWQMTIVDHVKLFRNLPELRFEHRIHEQILPSIRRRGGNVCFTHVHVVHSGSCQSPQTRKKKLERDFRILKLDLLECPDHPFVLFNMGMTCEDAGMYEDANEYLLRSIQVAGQGESHLRKAWALRINCLSCMGQIAKAIDTATEALDKFPGDKELLFRRALLFQNAQRLVEAVADYEQILQEPLVRTFQSIDPSIYGHKANHNLGTVLQDLGRIQESRDCWNKVVAECPEFGPAWLALLRSCIAFHDFDDARSVLERMPGKSTDSSKAIGIALLLESQSEVTEAATVLEEAWEVNRDADCLDELARILTTAGRIDEAVPSLKKLRKARPKNAAVLHNLGAALDACSQSISAIDCLRESLLLRPDASHSSQLLAELYCRGGQSDLAREVLQVALVHSPKNDQLSAALAKVAHQQSG